MKKLRELFLRFKRELQLYRNILADPRTPKITKILLGCAVGYAISPVDIIPDFIPVVGHLDDAIIVPVLIYLALKTIPPALLAEHRQEKRAQDVPLDPLTQRPIARDFRYHRFTAHQREHYFLNRNW